MNGLIILIICAVILIVSLLTMVSIPDNSDKSIFAKIIDSIVVVSFCLFVVNFICLPIAAIASAYDYVEQPPQSISILALQDSQNVSGRMYCRSGYIDEKLYYYTMYNTDKGAYVWKLPSDMSFVTETNDENPHVEIYRKNYNNKFFRWYLGDNLRDDYYKIYVPKGTVSQSFNIDLK